MIALGVFGVLTKADITRSLRLGEFLSKENILILVAVPSLIGGVGGTVVGGLKYLFYAGERDWEELSSGLENQELAAYFEKVVKALSNKNETEVRYAEVRSIPDVVDSFTNFQAWSRALLLDR